MWLYDSFCYNGEEILPFKIKHQYDVVDQFFIIESIYTFSGIRKPHYYIDIVMPYLHSYRDKITVIKIEEFPPVPEGFGSLTDCYNMSRETWWKEFYQRNYVLNLVKDIQEDYVLIVGDVDEIVHKDILRQKEYLYQNSDEQLYLGMDLFHYNLKWLLPNLDGSRVNWTKAIAKNNKNIQNYDFSALRMTPEGKFLWRTGWHLSYCTSAENILRKMKSYSHIETLQNLKNEFGLHSDTDVLEFIKSCMKKGKKIGRAHV